MSRTGVSLEFSTRDLFPTTGSTSILYIATDTNKLYRWDGSTYVLIGDGTGGTPASPDTSAQFNDGGVFGGFGKYDKVNDFFGVGVTPNAKGHFGVDIATVEPVTSLSLLASAFGIAGYTLGSGDKTYSVYAKQNSPLLYSPVDSQIMTEPTPSDYNVPSFSSTPNYSESGYTADGKTFAYEVWAVYSGQISPTSQTSTTSDDNSSNSYAVDLSWGTPANSTGLTSYLIKRTINGGIPDYRDTGNTNTVLVDDNSGWGSPASPYPVLSYEVDISFTASVDPVDDYLIINTTTNKYILTGGALSATDADDWTSSAPGVSPFILYGNSLFSEGNTSLVRTGGTLDFFGASGVTQQGGDISDALAAYGLVLGGTFSLDDVSGGILHIANGGTGVSSFASNNGGLVFKSDNGQLASSNNIIISDGFSLNLGDGINFSFQGAGTKFGLSNTEKWGAWNTTPIVQPVNTVAINDVLTTIGLRASGGFSNFTTTIKPRTGGTATGSSPMLWASGSLLTSPVIGSDEFLSDKRYFTITTGTARKEYTLNDSALTSGKVPVITTNGRLTDGGATTTELSYLSGVTSAIQTQLNGKQASGTYVTGATNATLTLTSTTLGLNLSNANTWAAKQTFSTANISITGGANTNILSTDGAGNVSWVALPSSGITALTGDVTASGSGSVAATLATAQPAVHTWALGQTFTVAPTFSAMTATRIPFFGTAGLFTDDSKFVWDNTNKALNLGAAPGTTAIIATDATKPMYWSSNSNKAMLSSNSGGTDYMHVLCRSVSGVASIAFGHASTINAASPTYSFEVREDNRVDFSGTNGKLVFNDSTAGNKMVFNCPSFTYYMGIAVTNGGTVGKGAFLFGRTTAIGTTVTPAFTANEDLQVIFGGVTIHTAYTVAGLPAAVNYTRAFVSDALAPVWGAAVTGGGAVKVPVYYDGGWKVG